MKTSYRLIRNRLKCGFVLIEVLFAVMIMSTCLGLIMQSYFVSLKAIQRSYDHFKLLALTETEMLKLMKLGDDYTASFRSGVMDQDLQIRITDNFNEEALEGYKNINLIIKAVNTRGQREISISTLVPQKRENRQNEDF